MKRIVIRMIGAEETAIPVMPSQAESTLQHYISQINERKVFQVNGATEGEVFYINPAAVSYLYIEDVA